MMWSTHWRKVHQGKTLRSVHYLASTIDKHFAGDVHQPIHTNIPSALWWLWVSGSQQGSPVGSRLCLSSVLPYVANTSLITYWGGSVELCLDHLKDKKDGYICHPHPLVNQSTSNIFDKKSFCLFWVKGLSHGSLEISDILFHICKDSS